MKHYSRRSVYLLCAMYFLAMFSRMGFNESSGSISSSLDLNTQSLAWIGSVFFWVYLIVQVPIGLLIDATGARLIGFLGCVAMGFGSLIFASADSAAALAIGRGLCAAGAVSGFLSMLTYSSQNYGEHANSEIGLGFMVGNIGGIIAGIPLAYAITFSGWRSAWAVFGCISLLIAMLLTIYLDGEKLDKARFSEAMKKIIPSFSESFKHSEVYLTGGSIAGLAGAFYGFTAFDVFTDNTGAMEHTTKGILLSTMIAGYCVGAWIWGRLGDDIDTRHKVLRLSPVGGVAMWAVLAALSGYNAGIASACVALFLLGVFSGSVSCVYTAIDELCANKPAASIKATANCGVPLGAAIIEVSQGYLPSSAALYPCLALATIGMLCSLKLASRWKASADTGFGALSAES